eukprot:1121889-Amphidinium_carterae.1
MEIKTTFKCTRQRIITDKMIYKRSSFPTSASSLQVSTDDQVLLQHGAEKNNQNYITIVSLPS